MPAAVLLRPRVRSTLDRIACWQSDFRGFVDFLHAELDRVGPEQAVRRGTASRRCYRGGSSGGWSVSSCVSNAMSSAAVPA
jgi:hypothetical protein